jgi:hypothetical protein
MHRAASVIGQARLIAISIAASPLLAVLIAAGVGFVAAALVITRRAGEASRIMFPTRASG